MADYYNLLGAAQKAPRATARAPKSSLRLGQLAGAEIADGALFFVLLLFFCKSSLKLGQVAAAEIADGAVSVDSS